VQYRSLLRCLVLRLATYGRRVFHRDAHSAPIVKGPRAGVSAVFDPGSKIRREKKDKKMYYFYSYMYGDGRENASDQYHEMSEIALLQY